jgi:alpha-ketoglutarate-dependent taurine dioxygenase
MKITKIEGFGSFGNIVEDVDLENISEEDWYEIKMCHSKNLLTIIRLEKKLDYKKYYSLIQNIGIHNEISPISIQKLFGKKSLDEINKIKKISDNFKVDKNFGQLFRVTALKDENGLPLGAFDDGELLWHSNNAGLLEFGPGVALMGYQQMTKSATGFLQTADYFETLSETFKKELMDMVVVHNYKKATINPEEIPDQELVYETSFCPEENSKIPLVIKSPSGIVGLHIPLNTIDYIEGMCKRESDKLLECIKKDLFSEKYIYDYWWENDQNILLFDNSITLHRRLVKGNSCGNRIAYRIPFSYESLYGYYEPYFQKKFSDLRKDKCNYCKSISYSDISSSEIKKIQIMADEHHRSYT